MDYSFGKDRLPRGLSYPLKRSDLDEALEAAQVEGVHSVYYSRRCSNLVLVVRYCGEGNRGWFAAGLSSITVYAVPSQERKAIEAALLKDGLPLLIKWLKESEGGGNTWRGVNHSIDFEFRDGELRVAEI